MSESFIDALYATLRPGGIFHFATDHLSYFDEIMEGLAHNTYFRQIEAFEPVDSERTDFELLFIDNKPIGRSSFQKRDSSPVKKL